MFETTRKIRQHCLGVGLCFALFMLSGCTASNGNALDGHYTAVNPPVESGDMVILELVFTGDQVTMISGETKQTASYQLKQNRFILLTEYGDYSYDCSLEEENTITIDGVNYLKNVN